jgi:3-oxoacyl-[acyl-carrier protein] reductase
LFKKSLIKVKVKDKVVVVTGGAGALGRSIVNSLIAEGAKVVVLDFDKDALASLTPCDSLFSVFCDLTKEGDVSVALDDVYSNFGKVDILINNAGILHSEPLVNIMAEQKRHSLSTWNKVIEINLTAPFLITSNIAEKMVLTRTRGLIINISSISANGNAGQSAYSAAKAGLESLTKVWAKELGGFGIRSVAIAPGFIDTESTHQALNSKVIAHIKKETPIRKLGQVENIVSAINFVIENDYVNSKVIPVDGGLLF